MVYHQVVFCFYNAFNADNTELHVINRSSSFFDIKRYQNDIWKRHQCSSKFLESFPWSSLFIFWLISGRICLTECIYYIWNLPCTTCIIFFHFSFFFCKKGILYMGNFICFTATARRFAQVFCDLCGKQFNKIINKNICVVYICFILFSTHLTWSWRSISLRFRWSLLAWSHTFAWIR